MSGLSKSSLSSTAKDCSSCSTGQCTGSVYGNPVTSPTQSATTNPNSITTPAEAKLQATLKEAQAEKAQQDFEIRVANERLKYYQEHPGTYDADRIEQIDAEIRNRLINGNNQ